MEQSVNYIRTQVRPLAMEYIIRLDRELTEVSDFHEELATIRECTEVDTLHILISCVGGSVDTMKVFLTEIAQTKSHVICEIQGSCCSAATMIFLAGDELRISDDAEFMIHTQSFMYGGKESNVRQFVEFTEKSNRRLMEKYYKHYLTEDEIEQVIDGKDLWMDAVEINERLRKRAELFQIEEEAAKQEVVAQAELEMFGEPLPEKLLKSFNKDKLIRIIRGELSEAEEEDLLNNVE